jgi:hypothetical protein
MNGTNIVQLCPGDAMTYLNAVAERTTSAQLSKSRSAAMSERRRWTKKMEDK